MDHLKVVQLLVRNGVNKETVASAGTPSCAGTTILTATGTGATPLFFACRNVHLAVVQLLVSEGADKEKAMSDGATHPALHCVPAGPFVIRWWCSCCSERVLT
jgi:ankyrin repeat protein